MKDIDINEYDYPLPDDRIAQYPANERDKSNLLIYKQGRISKDIFINIHDSIPEDSLLVFNNTRVIRARFLFKKDSGAEVEVFCLEPLLPFEYELSFSSKDPVEWKCLIGNLKKWKKGKIVTQFIHNDKKHNLSAEKISPEGEAWRIKFEWDNQELNFGEVIEATGHIPLPPYIKREDEKKDTDRYQTVYSRIKGSVAAPTAGLHFTTTIFNKLREKGIKSAEVTLHVGAGTFQPIKSSNISEHKMHCEHFIVTDKTIKLIRENEGKIISVGTTSVRTLESLYWLGVKIIMDPVKFFADLYVEQWEPYDRVTQVTARQSIDALLNYMAKYKLSFIKASTQIMIIPGYDFRMINGIITNFHQPKSTLLLLISAWTGNNWKNIYNYALNNDFRFLSYGDGSLLLK